MKHLDFLGKEQLEFFIQKLYDGLVERLWENIVSGSKINVALCFEDLKKFSESAVMMFAIFSTLTDSTIEELNEHWRYHERKLSSSEDSSAYVL